MEIRKVKLLDNWLSKKKESLNLQPNDLVIVHIEKIEKGSPAQHLKDNILCTEDEENMCYPTLAYKTDVWCNWYECSNCHCKAITEDTHFCPGCGRQVDWKKEMM